MFKFTTYNYKEYNHSKPVDKLDTKSISALLVLYIAYVWLGFSTLAHFWVWQATHQGISQYGVFVFFWLLTTIVLGGVLLYLFVKLTAKPSKEQ